MKMILGKKLYEMMKPELEKNESLYHEKVKNVEFALESGSIDEETAEKLLENDSAYSEWVNKEVEEAE